MEKLKVYKTVNWLGENWYGDHFVWPDGDSTFPESMEEPMAQFIIRGLKTKILEHIPKPNRIENEQIIIRPSFKDDEYPQVFKGTIGWKAQLFWEDQ